MGPTSDFVCSMSVVSLAGTGARVLRIKIHAGLVRPPLQAKFHSVHGLKGTLSSQRWWLNWMERFFQNNTVIILRVGKKHTSKVQNGQSFSLVLKLAAECTHSLWGWASVKWKKHKAWRYMVSTHLPGAPISLSECVRYWSKMFLKMYLLNHWLLRFFPSVLPCWCCRLRCVACGGWHGMAWCSVRN